MCGVSGAFAFDNASFRVTERFVARMRDAWRIAARTAPASGWTPTARSALGHRRLSIIDLSRRRRQPMSNEDGSLWIIFNGEIYNHAALRARAVEAGRHGRLEAPITPTPKCILHAFEEWGIDCVSAVPRHVRVCVVGRAAARTVAGARSHRHQAALLLQSTTAA